MAERSTIYQVVQIGVESTAGTVVPTTKKLSSLMADIGPLIDAKSIKAAGKKYGSAVAVGSEYSSLKLKGMGTYTELIYPLAMMYAYTAPTQIGTTGAYTWIFNPKSDSADVGKTLTIEKGSTDGTGAERTAGNVLTGFKYSFDRANGLDFEGEGFGLDMKSALDSVTMTAGATSLAIIPIMGKHLGVWLDSTSAGLGTTRLTRVLKGEFGLSDARKPLWAVDDSQSSFAATVEDAPKNSFKLTMEADVQGLGLLANLRAGDVRYLRIKGKGANIGTSADYTFQHDACVSVVGVEPMSDQDGVYAIDFTLELIDDPDWNSGQAHTIKVINKLSTL